MSDETFPLSPSDPAPLPPTWMTLAVSVRGFSHERGGLENQDAAGVQPAEQADEPVYLAVADGHGSPRSFRSARGSELAAEAALHELRKMVATQNATLSFQEKRAQARREWPLALVETWTALVREDLLARPFTFYEFAPFPEAQPVLSQEDKGLPQAATLSYGATLLAVAVTSDYICYAQLGDGDILTILPDGRVRRPFPAHHTRLSSTTPSLCSLHAEFGVRVAVRPLHEKSPVLILLSTDGYANSFADETAFRQVGTDLLAYLRTEGLESVRNHLAEWLRSASVNGTGDDVTLGLVVRRDILAPDPISPQVTHPSAEAGGESLDAGKETHSSESMEAARCVIEKGHPGCS